MKDFYPASRFWGCDLYSGATYTPANTVLTLTFPYTGVSDYTSVSRMVTFSAGESSTSVSVPITNDTVIEDSEMFSGSLAAIIENVYIGADTANVTVVDDDGGL